MRKMEGEWWKSENIPCETVTVQPSHSHGELRQDTEEGDTLKPHRKKQHANQNEKCQAWGKESGKGRLQGFYR